MYIRCPGSTGPSHTILDVASARALIGVSGDPRGASALIGPSYTRVNLVGPRGVDGGSERPIIIIAGHVALVAALAVVVAVAVAEVGRGSGRAGAGV